MRSGFIIQCLNRRLRLRRDHSSQVLWRSPADQLSIKSLFTQAPLQSHHSRRWRGRGQQESTQSVFFRNNDPSRAERSSQSVIYVIYVICVICVICVIWWELEKKLFCTMMLKSERRCDSQFRWSWWKKRFEFKTLNFIDRIIHQIMFQLVGRMWRLNKQKNLI